uniref:Secreted protein n=1 Tax=Capra hircus TaxID=9925 RepID=A0A8C2QRI5_CAPHI
MVISAFKVFFSFFLIKEIIFLVTCLELPKGSLEKSLIIPSHLSKIAAANSTKQRWKNPTLATLKRSSENTDIPGSPRNKK